MWRSAVARGCEAELAVVRLGIGDELRHRAGGRGVRHDHGIGVLHDKRDRQEVGNRIVAELRIQVQIDGLKVSRKEDRVAIRSRARRSLGCDIAPPLLSITTCWPHVSESRAERMRAIASAPPPGGNGTITLTKRF